MIDKPPYRVPSMEEISAVPWNGLTVASTFSGCGGSCLGYRMAGFKVLWANEFVPAAQDSYRANAPTTYLDCRDIKHVRPEEALAQMGLAQGELDLFDGSPPCQAFSTAGKREKGWGHAKTYEHGASQCNETLFAEYVRLLRGFMPRTFVAENVSGLVKGTAKGYFLEILHDLKSSGYRVACRVCDAQWLGVPQCRQRAIFVGVREDQGREPVHPAPLGYRYSVRDALPWVVRQRFALGFDSEEWRAADGPSSTIGTTPSSGCGLNGNGGKVEVEWEPLAPSRSKGSYGVTEVDPDTPCATVTTASPGNDLAVPHGTERRKFTIAELKRICGFPDDFILTGSYAQQWERLGNSVPPVMMNHIASAIRDRVLDVKEASNGPTTR